MLEIRVTESNIEGNFGGFIWRIYEESYWKIHSILCSETPVLFCEQDLSKDKKNGRRNKVVEVGNVRICLPKWTSNELS